MENLQKIEDYNEEIQIRDKTMDDDCQGKIENSQNEQSSKERSQDTIGQYSSTQKKNYKSSERELFELNNQRKSEEIVRSGPRKMIKISRTLGVGINSSFKLFTNKHTSDLKIQEHYTKKISSNDESLKFKQLEFCLIVAERLKNLQARKDD